ncbi:MAG: HU family DNA-binding protein [Bacteroidaceae bacterium]|nr:HU family DNA-binding protein [Bacteroidaceae bacterium]
MSVTYAVRKCKNPGKNAVEGVTYYACRSIKLDDYTFDELAEDISFSTTVTKPDAQAVLAVIKPYITKALLAGRAVVLEDLGRFQISLQSKCFSQDAMAASDFSPSAQIKGHRIIFRPEVALKKEIASKLSLVRQAEPKK